MWGLIFTKSMTFDVTVKILGCQKLRLSFAGFSFLNILELSWWTKDNYFQWGSRA